MRAIKNIAVATFVFLLMSGAAFSQSNGYSFLVSIKNASGQPIKNACVSFIPKEGEILFRKADKHGQVHLVKLLPGAYRIVVKVDGYVAQKREVTLSSSEEAVAFTLEPRTER
ncbi:MAG: carboxypeptidase-like regulatory domain-containing protein [Pyrinomonadaceae bacterium]